MNPATHTPAHNLLSVLQELLSVANVRIDDPRIAVFDRARKAVSEELAAPSGWRLIDTAPKDELILVGPTKRMGICVAMHHSRNGWVTETCSEWVTIYTPTHWMPLPAEPPRAAIAKALGSAS